MLRIGALGCVCVTTVLTSRAGEEKTPITRPSGDWEWSISAGPSFRQIGTVRANTGFRSNIGIIPSFVGGESRILPMIGDPDSPADRVYDDGFVRQDAGTPNDGSTWFWGYDNPGQIQGHQLVFSATGSQSVRRDRFEVPNRGPFREDRLRGFTPHVQLDARSPHRIAGWKFGLSGAFDFTQVDEHFTFSSFSGAQFRDDFRLDIEDRFDLGGVIPPQAPYVGTFAGPGPVIRNFSTSRSINPVLLSTETASITNIVNTELGIDVFSFGFGPSFSRSVGPVNIGLQVGVMINVYDWNASQNEQLTANHASGVTEVARWAESDSGTKFRPAIYAQMEAFHQLDERISLGGYVRYDIAKDFRMQAGPTLFHVDPTAFTTGLMIRYSLP